MSDNTQVDHVDEINVYLRDLSCKPLAVLKQPVSQTEMMSITGGRGQRPGTGKDGDAPAVDPNEVTNGPRIPSHQETYEEATGGAGNPPMEDIHRPLPSDGWNTTSPDEGPSFIGSIFMSVADFFSGSDDDSDPEDPNAPEGEQQNDNDEDSENEEEKK